jgi:hypothetical protein
MLHACAVALSALVNYDALAVTAAGDVYRVDSNSAAVTLLNSTGNPMHCLARMNDGRMVSVADLGGGSARVLEIDVVSGSTSTFATLNLGGVVRGASFDANGALFVLVRPTAGGSDRLGRIDLTNFTFTDIGATGLATLEDLCVAPEGRIYAWDSGPGGANGVGLVELSRANGAALDLAPAGGSSDVLALAIDEVGELRGANFKLYSIDRASGVDLPIAPNTQISIEGFQYFAGMSRIDGALALERTGGLKRVNTTTGAVGPVFATLGGSPVAASFRPTGTEPGEYLVLRDLGSTTELLRVNPSTGAATSLATYTLDDVLAAYFYPLNTNSLFLLADGGPGQPDVRHAIQMDTLVLEPAVQITGFEDIGGASFDFSLRAIGWDRTRGFFNFGISPVVVPLDLNPGPAALANLATLRHDPQGRLFSSNGALQRLSVSTESAAPVGSASLGDLVSLDFLTLPTLPRPVGYCSASTNSANCTSQMSTAGPIHPSASESSGFLLLGLNQIAQKQGLLFYGINGRNAVPFSSGFLCVAPPLRRTGLVNSGGTTGCTGRFTTDFNAWVASGADPALTAGVKVNSQFWGRDPAAPSTTSVTNGTEFFLAP